MNLQPQDSSYRPVRSILELRPDIGDPVKPADFPKTILRYRNDRWARAVGLEHLDGSGWLDHFGRFAPLPGNLQQPLALRYHGHQFRHYNPEIGDGRGFLFAQMRDHKDRLMDLGTKGSGTTPWSRMGDGRLTLKGGVREILATEMLEALGVETSKTFSLIETGESLERNDEPSPTRSAVMVRLSHSHIRFGTFQRIAFEENEQLMRQLVRYSLNNFYGGESAEHDAALLLHRAAEQMAKLAASYMVAGFVHGVLNTDNMNITGESFDYGPWRFTPKWDAGFTAAYFDQQGLYSFGRQPEAIHWNLGQLAVALRLICPAEPLIEALEQFAPLYQEALAEHFCWRLGVQSKGLEPDRSMIAAAEAMMRQDDIGIDRFFFDWMGGDTSEQISTSKAGTDFAQHMKTYTSSRSRGHGYWQGSEPQSMLIDEVETIWDAIADDNDWNLLQQKIRDVRTMGAALRSN
ncbi:protein adenylyltransferase SelO family protein [Sphingorhabdus sp. Alg239-R122]|uniref:protein adenylyltransferase SelO family protein n=1 Tax=Sphingorhabdus sp. Alg239-R122 TaxID=2305989 RepID=UPI0013DBBE8A|nr:YdiU family protein [Sphingorhabdus sp. Alg239-R122]